MHLFDIAGKVKDRGRKSKVFLDKPSFLKRIRRSIVARISIQLWKYTIPFGSNNPESRIFYDSVREHQPEVSYLLRFRSGASTRSLVFFYDSVREHQPGVSYFSYDSVRDLQSGVSYFSYDSVREHQPGVSYLSTIPFGSINPESRIYLRFHSGASTRSLVSFCDSVREH